MTIDELEKHLLIPVHKYLKLRGWRKVSYIAGTACRVWNHDRYYTTLENEAGNIVRKIYLPFDRDDAFRKQAELDRLCWTELYSLDLS